MLPPLKQAHILRQIGAAVRPVYIENADLGLYNGGREQPEQQDSRAQPKQRGPERKAGGASAVTG